jgi:hypothetical protein
MHVNENINMAKWRSEVHSQWTVGNRLHNNGRTPNSKVTFNNWKDRTGWSRGNALHMYSVGAGFQSWPGHRLSWLHFFATFLSLSRQILTMRYINEATTASFDIPSNSSLTSNHIIWHYVVSIMKVSINSLRKKLLNNVHDISHKDRRSCWKFELSYLVFEVFTVASNWAYEDNQYYSLWDMT